MVKFKLFPVKGSNEYYMCYIYDDWYILRQSYQRYAMYKNLEAVTVSYKAYNGKKLLNVMGEVMFYKEGITPEVVSHEMTHAVNKYFNRKKFNFKLGNKISDMWKELDEWHATMVGYMVEQFYKKYDKVK